MSTRANRVGTPSTGVFTGSPVPFVTNAWFFQVTPSRELCTTYRVAARLPHVSRMPVGALDPLGEHADRAPGDPRLVGRDGREGRSREPARLLEGYREAVRDQEARAVFPFPGPAEWPPDAWAGRKSRDWIESCDQDRPMFAWVSFSGPHFPFDLPEEYLSRVDESLIGEPDVDPAEWTEPGRLHYQSFHGPARGRMEGGGFHDRDPAYWRRLRRHYLAQVALVDDQVGG